MGVLHSFSIKNIFHDKMELRLFLFACVAYVKKKYYVRLYLIEFDNFKNINKKIL